MAVPSDAFRVLDAAANRAREGLRVLEDLARFVLDDAHLTRLLKELRHELTDRIRGIDDTGVNLAVSRDTAGDVGTTINTPQEGTRAGMLDIAAANSRRTIEALRTLEEFGKTLAPDFARGCENLRYRLYTIEKALLQTLQARDRLADCRLCLLVSSALCRHDAERVIREALAGGVTMIQIREKFASSREAVRESVGSDRSLLAFVRRVRDWTRDAASLLIVNDRPDLAVLADADGVHVGQDDLPVREARRIVGPERLVGVSTHSIEQARQAVIDGADYLGVGPVFASLTKQFDQLAGLPFVRQAAAEISLPWFAIGGISAGNFASVREAGATRVAVSSAICGADNPRGAAESLAQL